MSIQAQIINLLEELQERIHLTYLFIAHDLVVVRHISRSGRRHVSGQDRGVGRRDRLYENPLHPYTQALLSAVPIPDPVVEAKRQRLILEGDVPSPTHPPTGCSFSTRCPLATEQCRTQAPEFQDIGGDHWVSCHLA